MSTDLAPVATIAGPSAAEPWCTATLRPVGTLRRAHARRIAECLAALAGSASVVCLDLEAATLQGRTIGRAVGAAASALTRHGGALLVVHATPEDRALLAAEAPDAVVVEVTPEAVTPPVLVHDDAPAGSPVRRRVAAVVTAAAVTAGAVVAPAVAAAAAVRG